MQIINFILVILSTMLADIAWTLYFIRVSERRSISSGIWSALIIVFSAFTTINFINNYYYIFAAMIGAFLGTTLTIEYEKRKRTKP